MSGALQIVNGSVSGRVLKIKADVHVEQVARNGNISQSVIPAGWTRAIVLTVDKQDDNERAFILSPSDPPFMLEFPPFQVEGPFLVAEKINNPRAARKAWEDFGPARAREPRT